MDTSGAPNQQTQDKLTNIVKAINAEEGMGTTPTKDYTQQMHTPQSSVGYLKSIKRTPH